MFGTGPVNSDRPIEILELNKKNFEISFFSNVYAYSSAHLIEFCLHIFRIRLSFTDDN